MASSNSKFQAFWNHPTGPKTIFFWAPAFKWCLTGASIADFDKPPEQVSYAMHSAIVVCQSIYARWSTVITPKNVNLFSVSVAMVATSSYQLARKLKHDYSQAQKATIEPMN